jgi:WD40 repeat protein
MAGHYSPNNKWTNEVWGLCIDNKSNKFFTCSDDATLRCWDMKTRQMLSVSSLNWGPMKDGECKVLQKDQKTKDYSDASKGRVVALSPDRDELVVGCKNGVVRMYGFDAKTNSMSYKMMFRKATA